MKCEARIVPTEKNIFKVVSLKTVLEKNFYFLVVNSGSFHLYIYLRPQREP